MGTVVGHTGNMRGHGHGFVSQKFGFRCGTAGAQAGRLRGSVLCWWVLWEGRSLSGCIESPVGSLGGSGSSPAGRGINVGFVHVTSVPRG